MKTRAPKVGEELVLTGPRFDPRVLMRAPCADVRPIWLVIADGPEIVRAVVNGTLVDDLEHFARLDGFSNAQAMAEFFWGLYGPGEFHGVMIEW